VQQRYDRLFIGGEWVEPLSGRHFGSIDPSTEDVWATIAEAGAADIDAAVNAARGWRAGAA
jgi:aldehyde dehydrogenase (NAD+)